MPQVMSQRERYDLEWNGWKAAAGALEGVRRYGQISRRVAALAPERMLDVGCGDGRLAREIKQVLASVVVHGCDLSVAALDRAEGLIESMRSILMLNAFLNQMVVSIWWSLAR